MFNSTKPTLLRITASVLMIAAIAISPCVIAHEHDQGKEGADASNSKEITGEIVDMMCYVDHNAVGEQHGQACGAKCIKNGGPVGIVSDGKAYLVVGEHKPINDELAAFCGKTITLKGKLTERGGISLLENAEIVKK